MQSRALLNIALLLLVAALAAYLYYGGEQDDTGKAETPLAQLSRDEVNRINIRHNQRQVELHKEQQQWRMLQPIAIDANAFRIDTLLNMLGVVSHAVYSADELELHKYGLADSKTSISFNELRMDFGIVNPINSYRYVRSGESVHLIDDHYYPLLSSQAGTLVARELIAANAEILKLELPGQTLYREDNKLWRSSAADTDPDAINETLYHWQHSQAFGVHNYMQREALDEVRVTLAGHSEAIVFEITDTDPWLIIARPELDIEYHFNLEFYDRLLRPGSDTEAIGEIGAGPEAAVENGR